MAGRAGRDAQGGDQEHHDKLVDATRALLGALGSRCRRRWVQGREGGSRTQALDKLLPPSCPAVRLSAADFL